MKEGAKASAAKNLLPFQEAPGGEQREATEGGQGGVF